MSFLDPRSHRYVRPALGLLALVLGLALASPAPALRDAHDPLDPYRKIRISWDVVRANPGILRGTEVMGLEEGAWVDVAARNAELESLRDAGVPFEVLVPDLEAQAAARSGGGDFGIFHTYVETVAFLDSLHAANPDITTDKISLGTTWEGRHIWAMKISDNPNMEEAEEPEVLFDSLHHSREIITVEVLIDYMSWLCSGYGVDPEATELVDNRQIWFVPVVNPDGVVYNQTTNPNGGGLWRKNRRDDFGGCVGVDVNRNYPYEWGLDSGSSSDPCSETFRGPAAASELETQAMMSFIENHDFVTHNSYHSVVGAILFPWAYTSSPLTPDDATFRDLATEMARDSGYPHGTVWDILSYLASGGMFDWTYGEQASKPKIFSFTTEVGGSSWWPAESERDGLVNENHYSNVFLTRVAGVSLGLDAYAISGGDGNGRLDPGETANLVVTVRNFGVLADAAGVSVTLASDDSYLALGEAFASLGAIAATSSGDNAGDPFVVTALASTPAGHLADLDVTIEEASGFTTTETLTLTIGQAPVLFAEDFEAGVGGWEQDPSHGASTGDFVRIDPNPTTYQPGDDTTPDPGVFAWVTGQNTSEGNADVDGGISATRSPIYDLSSVGSARLMMQWFHGQRDPGDDAGDFFRIDLSNDGGSSYPASLVSVGDVGHSAVWRSLVVDLGDVLPLTNSMRLRIQASDGSSTGDIIEGGIDDVFLLDTGSGNDAPGAPALVSPADGATGQPVAPMLVVSNATDPEGDPLTYTFRVYSDALLTSEVASVTGVVEGGEGTTSWTVNPSLAVGTYHWRAHASDAESQGLYMTAGSFTVDAVVSADIAVGSGEAQLHAPRPSPFRSGADIAFTLAKRARVRIDIFDVHGRHVRKLFEGLAESGPQVRHWDGTDAAGRSVANGVYFVQMHLGDFRQTRKAVRLQ